MFGRSKPRTTSAGSRMPSRSTISSRTGGEAVAVSASTGGRPIASATRAEAQVVGPEVVAPLADAVRLVDDEQLRLAPSAAARASPRCASCSGARNTNSSVLRLELLERLLALAAGAERVDLAACASCSSSASTWSRWSASSGDTTTVGPPCTSSRQLVDRGLAGARRHHGERVAAGEHGLDRLALPRPQPLEAELPPRLLEALRRRGPSPRAAAPGCCGRRRRRGSRGSPSP